MLNIEEFISEKLAMEEMINILDHLRLNRPEDKASTHGGEWQMPCPLCKLETDNGGTKRCQFWPSRPYFGRGSKDDPSWWCRDCGKSGDLVGLYQKVHNVTFKEALWHFNITSYTKRESGEKVTFDPRLEQIEHPDEQYMTQAWKFVEECMELLWSAEGAPALSYLFGRGFKEQTIRELKWGYQPEPRRWDAAAMWGLSGGNLRIHKGVVIPEFQLNRDTGEIIVPCISIRRSDMDMLEEEADTGRVQHKYNVIRDGARGLYNIGLRAALPATLHEGQFNAAIAWQEGRGQFAAAALQSSDGCRDNAATTLALMGRPQYWLLNMEADPDGLDAADYWYGHIENCLVHHPPNKMDLNEYHVSGGDIYEFLMAGAERYQRFQRLYGPDGLYPRQNEAEGPLETKPVQSRQEDQQGCPTITTAPSTPIFEETIAQEAWQAYKAIEPKYSEANQALAIPEKGDLSSPQDRMKLAAWTSWATPVVPEEKSEPVVDPVLPHFRIMALSTPELEAWEGLLKSLDNAVESRQDEAGVACVEEMVQSHQDDEQEPPTAILEPLGLCCHCGGPGPYADVWGNIWCRSRSVAVRLMHDGADAMLRYGALYLGEPDHVKAPVFEAGVTTLQELPATREHLAMGRSAWLEFCKTASDGDLWRAATEAHHILVGFAANEKAPPKPVILIPCARQECMYDAARPWRQNNDRVRDKRGYETEKYRHPLQVGHKVTCSEAEYTFCPRCLTASYLLELVKDLGYLRYRVAGKADIEGEAAWVEYARTASMFGIFYVFDPLRREYPDVWYAIQQEVCE